METRKLILRNFLSPGDLVMLTAAVRDLHQSHPGQFLTDVRSSCPELWEHNPHLTPLLDTDPEVEQLDCQYPLIHRSNDAPYHCLHGFTQFLSTKLGLDLRPAHFRGDIHLSPDERRWKSVVHELAGIDLPFWIVNAGGKFDFTIKWWDHRRYQRIIDHFRDRILFVQVGEVGHYHPPLRGVIDLRGRTDLRQLVRLVYHSEGVLCGVTALMHLAAAVPTREDRPPVRAAVVIAGGREPTHWEAYPHHQFIHTIGALPCCAAGGCWRARTHPIGDGEDSDRPEKLCCNVVGHLPRCMDMITAQEVIRRIELYMRGGYSRGLTAREQSAARRAVARTLAQPRFESTVHLGTAPQELARAARVARRARIPVMHGRGILILAEDDGQLAAALKCARAIRRLGCTLPIECWTNEGTTRRGGEFRLLRTKLIRVAPGPRSAQPPMTSTELRLHALEDTCFREVLAIDAARFPLISPDAMFQWRHFATKGVILARGGLPRARPGVWKLCGLELPRHTASDVVILIDRQRCWAALRLWQWISERMYFFSGYVDGAGGAAQLAFHRMDLRPELSSEFRNAFSSEVDEPALHKISGREHRSRARPRPS